MSDTVKILIKVFNTNHLDSKVDWFSRLDELSEAGHAVGGVYMVCMLCVEESHSLCYFWFVMK